MGKALRVFILKMFLGRVYRQKKRKLLLLAVQTPPEASSMSLWRPPMRHVPSRERDWVESTFRAHSAFCGCTNPVIHFTSVLARFNLQGGPQTPPDDPPEGAPVLRALPARARAGDTPRARTPVASHGLLVAPSEVAVATEMEAPQTPQTSTAQKL